MSERPNRIILESITLAIITSILYVFTYTFDYWFALFFGIPSEFIYIDISSILIYATAITLLFPHIFNLLSLLPVRETKVLTWTFAIPILLAILVYTILKYSSSLAWQVPIIVIFIFFFWTFVIHPLIKYKGKLTDRWERSLNDYLYGKSNISASVISLGIGFFVKPDYFKPLVILYWGLMIGLVISGFAGYRQASMKRTFIVPEDSRNILIVRRWGDNFVGISYDSTSNTLLNSYYLIPYKPTSKTTKYIKVSVKNLNFSHKPKTNMKKNNIKPDDELESGAIGTKGNGVDTTSTMEK